MEQEFKNRILDYLVGNMTPTKPYVPRGHIQNAPKINQVKDAIDLSDLIDYTTENNLNDIKIITSNDKIIMYGRKGNTNNGFILLLDNEFNVIQLMTSYEGGTLIPVIRYLKQIEDGTFIALASTYNNNPNTFYLLQLNNFTLTLGNEYKLKYKQQYQLPSTMQNQLNEYFQKFEITKKQGEAKYLFTYLYATDVEHSVYKISMNTLQINVGSENEWTHNTSDDYIIPTSFDLYAEWYQDNYRVKFNYDEGISEGLYEYKFVNGTLTNNYLYEYKGSSIPFTTTSVVIKDFDNTFASIWHMIQTGISRNLIYRFNKEWYDQHNKECIIYVENTGDYDTAPLNWDCVIKLYISNNVVLGYEQYDGTYRMYYFTDDNTEYPSKAGGGAIMGQSYYYNTSNEVINIYNMNNIYNLYSVYLLPNNWQTVSSSFGYNFNFIYNINNYNGISYNDYNAMIPNSGTILDENDNLIFARNLYNVSINQNTTESTLEIPNTYLNDNIINTQNLYSQTNSLLNSNEQSITKNIYETLYINFFNTINIKNANDPNNVIINVPGASRLNGSISGYNSYSNVKIGLVKVNYTDNTSQNITGLEITKNSDTNYTISFVIYVPKEISSIQIMSADGMTTYQTINPTLETEKIYRITQDVKIV